MTKKPIKARVLLINLGIPKDMNRNRQFHYPSVMVLLACIVIAAAVSPCRTPAVHPPVKNEALTGIDFAPASPHCKEALESFKKAHPVLPHYPYPEDKALAGAGELVKLGLHLKKLIPQQNADIKCVCPKCGKDSAWRLDMDRLNRLLCAGCLNRFPNIIYPENHTETFRSYFGESVEIRYHRAKDGTLHCFQGKLDHLKFKYLVSKCEYDLGCAYHMTGEERYAKLACFILTRLAENASGFLYGHRGSYTDLLPWPRDVEAAQDTAHFPAFFSPEEKGTQFPCGVFPGQQEAYKPFIDLYDLTYSSSVYDTQKVDGLSAREKINRDFFGCVARYMEAATECFGDEPHEFSNTGNICSQYKVPARIARVTGRWEDVRLVYYQQLRLTQDRWRRNYDAMAAEGPGYHLVWLGHHLQAVYHMMHMEYPPDTPEMRRIFDQTRGFEEMARSRGRIMMPNKTVPNLEDMGKREKPSDQLIAESICNILPGYGHAVLGAGSEPMQQVQAHLQFSRFDNHAHRDCPSPEPVCQRARNVCRPRHLLH